MKWFILSLVFLLLLYIVWEIHRSRTHIEAEEFILSVPLLPDGFEGFRIAFLSDIHDEGNVENLLSHVRALHPDMVLFGGDMLHKKRATWETVLPLMESLAKEFPTYAACGNHEEIIKEKFPDLWHTFQEKTASAGVRWLENEWIPIHQGASAVFLGGISVYYDYYYHPKGHTASDYLGDGTRQIYPPPEGVRILMAHDPIQLGIYTKWGIDIVLSGHVHGGIIRLPGIGGLLSPARTFCPPRDNGLYKRGNTQMVVSRGLGNRAIIPRFWNRPHLPLIILTKEKEHETI